MIWEQGCVVIVNLTRLSENGVTVCHRYWPEEGSDLYHIYEVTIDQRMYFVYITVIIFTRWLRGLWH